MHLLNDIFWQLPYNTRLVVFYALLILYSTATDSTVSLKNHRSKLEHVLIFSELSEMFFFFF